MKSTDWENMFLGFFILTVISAIYLIFQKDYVVGIFGSITGLFLIYLQKANKTKEESK